MKRIATICGLAALTTWASARTADAACMDGSVWSGTLPMKVYVNETLDDDLCAGSGCGGLSDLVNTIKKTMNQWYMETGSTFRMTYMGTTTAARGDIIADSLHIFSNPCTGALGVAAWNSTRTWGKIRMCTANGSTTLDWEPDAFDQSGSTKWSFQNVLNAEMAHIVGFKHEEDCASPVKSISSGDYEDDLSHLFRDDIEFLRDNFGVRTNNAQARTSTDGITWVNGLTEPADVADAPHRVAASNSASGTKSFIAFTDVDSPYILMTGKYDSSWSMLSSPLFASSPYHAGIASASDTDARVQFLGGYASATGQSSVYEAATTNGGSSWGASTVISSSGTFSHTTMEGVSSTYDPATGQYIRVWRGGFHNGTTTQNVHEIFYKVGNNAVQRLLDGSGNPYLASDTPSIACGATAVVGSENCLLAWTDGKSWNRTVRWFQASVNGSGVFVPSTLKTHGYISLTTASVAYTGDASYPWMIVLNQGGTATYSWRKAAASSSSFVDQRSFSDSPHAMVPTLGSRVSSGTDYAISIVGSE